MGELISFDGGEKNYEGYLATASGGSGIGLIVLQEYWGLVDHIKDVCDRFAAEGFTALAPDLFFGERTTEPTRAGEMMMALNISETEQILARAVEALRILPSVNSEKVGIIGFCMGGQLAMFAACHNPTIGACVNFYGIHPHVHPSFRQLECPILGVFAETDPYAGPEVVKALDEELTLLGKTHDFETFPGTQHAFFNDARPEVFNADASSKAWNKTLTFLRQNLAG
ncbi:MAG: hypothetical protein BGO01_13705 [Armatimonadetes bacterium 55-13]|nr:dienelactone hydrolase family protein [Armatimonadota bacterium]OJU64782.1 MAG: hypothetical protein BGO01_13705 [Armatimonadetes bacterium 55-13]